VRDVASGPRGFAWLRHLSLRLTGIAHRSLGFILVSGLGYASAGLGFAAELFVAMRHGATASTDMYRWCGLVIYNALGVIATFAIPILMRSRVASEKSWPLCALLVDENKFARTNPYLLVATAVTGASATLVCAADILVGISILSLASAVLSSVFLILLCALCSPAFFAGKTGIAIGFNAAMNATIAVNVLLFPSIDRAMSAGYLSCILLCTAAAVLFLKHRSIQDHVPDFLRQSEHPEPVGKTLMPLVRSTISTSYASAAYYAMLTATAPGLLSIYVTMSKAAMLLAAPTNAIMNSFMRKEATRQSGRSGSAVATIIGATLPVALVTPLFAEAAYLLLSAIYRIAPGTKYAAVIQVGIPMVICTIPITVCFGLLVLSSATAKHTAQPAIFAVVMASAAYVFGKIIPEPIITIMLPALGATAVSLLSLMWVSWKMRDGYLPVASLLLASAMFGMLSYFLVSSPISSSLAEAMIHIASEHHVRVLGTH
jgi:hypothetical protein